MLFNQEKKLWRWYIVLTVVFAIIISFNFTKPFGFFRESNPALVAINASYWKNNPDVTKKYIPVCSYAFNKELPPSTQFDNTITTFGFAWFAVPYYFLQLTNIPAGPVGLRIFSLFWLALTVFAIYKLASQLNYQLPNKKTITFITIALYLISPVVLWYQVNGYVHETAVLPCYYLAWYFFLRLLQDKQTKWLWLTAIFLFTGIQFDWLPFFQGIVMSAYLLFSRKEKLPKWMFLVPGLAIISGILVIVYTYSSWSSMDDYAKFMKWKFLSRTVGEEGHSFLSFWPAKLNIFLFYIISYGILLIWLVIGLIKKNFHPFLLLMLITAVLHHIVFFGFSSEHDYATLKMAFPIIFIAAMAISQMKKRNAMISLISVFSFAIIQYFLLHNYSFRKGMYADEHFFKKTGVVIKKLPADAVIFVDTDNKYFPQLEFYAGKAYKMASSVEDAKQQLHKNDTIQKAIFLDVEKQTQITLR
jgi:hypothetical protein